MKKIISILLFLTLGFTNLFAIDERVTDFYFGNGVWNTEQDATDNKDALGFFIRNDLSITEHSSMKLAYNWENGGLFGEADIVETFYQMKEEGQLSLDSNFFTAIASLAIKNPFYSKLVELAITLFSMQVEMEEKLNIKEMLESYQNSINSGHKVESKSGSHQMKEVYI